MRISIAILFAGAVLLAGCSQKPSDSAAGLASVWTGGNVQRGMSAVSRFGCGSCHTIGGLSSAHGMVGPPLTGIRNRMYVAGMLPNNPGNIIQWIYDPKSVNPKTVMPKVGLSRQDATDIAAYLYSQ
ncbi:MAG TPA: c-type cytochrome [Candidatus Limnocylindrales bacterium]|jgi:cytochrome c|nr:c-type cytochrome [Candidatus Limnocylindrales bacterium]